MNDRLLSIILLLCVFSAPALSATVDRESAPPGYPALSRYGGDFTLSDTQGRPFSLRDSQGKVVLIYFGFTSCASTCPVTLGAITAAMRSLGPVSARVQPLFISVDPKRDTPRVLRAYLERYHSSILALTGTQEQLDAVAAQYRAPLYVRKPDTDGDYVVDHSSYLYVVGPDGKLANLVRLGDPPEKIVRIVRDLLEQGPSAPTTRATVSRGVQ